MTVPQRVLDIMNSGEVYAFDDPEILQAQADQMELLYEFNASRPSEPKHRRAIAEKLLGGYEEGAWIEPPCMPTGVATRISDVTHMQISISRLSMMAKYTSERR